MVGLYQGYVFSLLLFIMVLEALSRIIRSGCSTKFFYIGDLILVSQSLSGLKRKLKEDKKAKEKKTRRQKY